jgi:hypothetical protein
VQLPPEITATTWRGTDLDSVVTAVLSSGFLQPQATVAECGCWCRRGTRLIVICGRRRSGIAAQKIVRATAKLAA